MVNQETMVHKAHRELAVLPEIQGPQEAPVSRARQGIMVLKAALAAQVYQGL